MHRVVMRLLLPLFISAAPLAAQTDETGLLEGLVVDQSGATLLGAVVDVAMPDGAFPRQQTTSQDGSFRVGFLKPGFYDVRVRTIGYRPVVHTGVRIRAGQVTRLTVTQEAAPVQLDPVTVEATAPSAAAAPARGSWVRTWSIRSQPVDMLERIVVSEIGEHWSPKTAPPSTAPKHTSR